MSDDTRAAERGPGREKGAEPTRESLERARRLTKNSCMCNDGLCTSNCEQTLIDIACAFDDIRERCARLAEGGAFLTPDSPEARFGKAVARLIRDSYAGHPPESGSAGCVCGEPDTAGSVHRTDGPCYARESGSAGGAEHVFEPGLPSASCVRCGYKMGEIGGPRPCRAPESAPPPTCECGHSQRQHNGGRLGGPLGIGRCLTCECRGWRPSAPTEQPRPAYTDGCTDCDELWWGLNQLCEKHAPEEPRPAEQRCGAEAHFRTGSPNGGWIIRSCGRPVGHADSHVAGEGVNAFVFRGDDRPSAPPPKGDRE